MLSFADEDINLHSGSGDAARVEGLSNRKREADIRVINRQLLSVRSAVGISASLMSWGF